jgi:hypothetical protein
MSVRKTESERFALLLVADAKLVEAGESLRRAGLTKDCAQIGALRSAVARGLQTVQDVTYERISNARR